MFKFSKIISYFLILTLSVSHYNASLGSEILTQADFLMDPEDRPAIRMSYSSHECRTFYCPEDFDLESGRPIVNKTVGIPIANGDINSLEATILKLLQSGDIENFKGVLYIAGIDLRDEKTSRQQHKDLLRKYGLESQLSLKIISMPKEKIHGLTLKSARAFIQRAISWLPSLERDYERPQSGEVIAGLTTTALIELGTVYYLFETLPTTDAFLTLTFHTIILSAYAVYTKTIINWLLRPGFNTVESFLKQVALSLPFVLNYNIFGQFTPIVEFLRTHTVAETMAAFPAEVLEFATTQSVTLMLQTLFYYVVITRVIGDWANKQKGVQRSLDARIYRKIAEMPVLAADAVIIAIAAGAGATQLTSLGPMEINDGHVMLLALTAFSAGVYKVGLNHSFEVFSWLKNRVTPKALDFMRDDLGVDLRMASLITSTTIKRKTGEFKKNCDAVLLKATQLFN